MELKGHKALLVVTLSFVLISACPALGAVQQTFILDINSPAFVFREAQFNDTNYTQQYDFTSAGSVTYWVSMPRNSTVATAEVNATGLITPVYKSSVINGGGVLGISVGNVTADPGNEIVVGTNNFEGVIRVLYGNNGTLRRGASLFGSNRVLDTAVGNITSNGGNEIIAGVENDIVYVLDWSEILDDIDPVPLWSYSTLADVKSVAVGDLDNNGVNEVIAGADKLYVLNSAGGLVWHSGMQVTGVINSIETGDLISSPGNEIAVGASSGIYVFNSTGGLAWSKSLGTAINAIFIGDVNSDPGNEIVAGGSNSNAYLLNVTDTDGFTEWTFATSSQVNSVVIHNVVDASAGNEIILGSEDQKIYTLAPNGSLIWDFRAESQVKSVAAGELTPETGDEVLGGDINGLLYAFNFDLFPTNLSLNIDGGGPDWTSSYIKLRTTEKATGFGAAINSYLSSCQTVAGLCNVPITFASQGPGRLNISSLNITYTYNAYPEISYQTVAAWSRTSGIIAGEPVGSQARNITYRNTANAIEVRHVDIPEAANSCDFDGAKQPIAFVNGNKVCDISDYTIQASGQPPGDDFLWDDTMASGIPVTYTEGVPYNTTTIDNYFWRKLFNISNTTPIIFYNVIGNVTLNDGIIKGMEFLNVTWKGVKCQIIPQNTTADCDSGNPTYTQATCSGDNFDSCKEDTDSDGVVDYFRWRQPYTAGITPYEAGGSINLPPTLNWNSISPPSGFWGDNFNFTVSVNDLESDNVSIRLWIYLGLTGSWINGGLVQVAGSGNASFYMPSGLDWAGANSYLFEYQDFNVTSGQPVHSLANTSIFQGPTALKHNASVVHIQGSGLQVNRSESVLLVVRINDTYAQDWAGSNVNCMFWVSRGQSLGPGLQNTTNSTGHCQYLFAPNSSYTPGNQPWIAGVSQDSHYNDGNSSSFQISIKGFLNISLFSPYQGQAFQRSSANSVEARLIDEFGNRVNSSTINTSQYSCRWYFNGTDLGTTPVDATGACLNSITPGCGYATLGLYKVNTSLLGLQPYNYTIKENSSSRDVDLRGVLSNSMLSPPAFSSYHKLDTAILNSSTNDDCGSPPTSSYGTEWLAAWKHAIRISLTEQSGVQRTNEPFIVSGAILASRGVNLSDWEIAKTKVLLNGVQVPAEARPWTDGNKTNLNASQAYLNSYSDIVFLVNMSPSETKAYWIYYNETSVQQDIRHIENSGFDGSSLAGWECTRTSCTGQYCLCEPRLENTFRTAFISSEAKTQANIQALQQLLQKSLPTQYIKVRYKIAGENDTGSYVRLTAGNTSSSGQCDLSMELNAWKETLCQHQNFAGAAWINLTVHDVGDGGAEGDSTQVYIDYLCMADSGGNCITFSSGGSLSEQTLHHSSLGSSQNISWQISAYESVGSRELISSSTGQYYQPGNSSRQILIYGFSKASGVRIMSPYCLDVAGEIKCSASAPMTLVCNVSDAYTGLGILDYTANYLNDSGPIGSNSTNSTGSARLAYQAPPGPGVYNVTCSIASQQSVFYDVTAESSKSLSFTISTGNTTGRVLQAPQTQLATGMTRANNFTFAMNITLNNTGFEIMFNPQVNLFPPQGVYVSPASCPSLPPGSACIVQSLVTVTSAADPGNYNITANATWVNGDATLGSAQNYSNLSVEANTVLNIAEDGVNSSIPVGASKSIGNITIEAFGNTQLSMIAFFESGQNASSVVSWISYQPSPPLSVPKAGSQQVSVNLNVPLNATKGEYQFYVLANATGSSCIPASECWDSVFFNITVTQPDWSRAPENMTKTIGLNSESGLIGTITLSNNLDSPLNFTISKDSNNNITLSHSSISVANLSSASVHVFHNATLSPVGTYKTNVTITNLNGAVPMLQNTSVTLEIINLKVDILTPNQGAPQANVNNGTLVRIDVNATFNGAQLSDNITWTAEIGGVQCNSLQAVYNSATRTWNLDCSAPFIPGNPINNSIKAIGNYISIPGMTLSDEEQKAAIYDDISPPILSPVSASSVNRSDNVPAIPIKVNVTDNMKVDSAWVAVYFGGSQIATLTSYSLNGNTYTFTFSNPNNAGDYDLVVYANDTGNRINSTTGWFEVYLPLRLIGEARNPKGLNQSVNFTLYRPGTTDIIHQFSTSLANSQYDVIVRKRTYDIKADLFGHVIRFNGADLNQSAVNQQNSSDPQNLTTPFRFDDFSNRSSEDISNILLPQTAENILLAFAYQAQQLVHASSSIAFDYTNALSAGAFQEGKFELFTCSSWNFNNRTCPVAFDFFDRSLDPDIVGNRFTFSPAGGSGIYAIAESCYPNICGASQPPPPGQPPSGGGGGGGGPSGQQAVCGNRVCEIGENDLNCPRDCLKDVFPFTVRTGISEVRIRPGENKSYPFHIANKADKPIDVFISASGEAGAYIRLEKSFVSLQLNGTVEFDVHVAVPESAEPGVYTGVISVSSEGKTQDIPVTILISLEGESLLSILLNVITKEVLPDGSLRFSLELRNIGFKSRFNTTLTYYVKDAETEEILNRENETVLVEQTKTFTKTMSLAGFDLPTGNYLLEVWADFEGKSVNSIAAFEVVQSFWETELGEVTLWTIIIAALGSFGVLSYRKYKKRIKTKARYVFPVDYRKLPQETPEAFWIGKIAETDKMAWFNPNDLMTHAVVAGSTGSGKSVGASVFVEEALERRIPTIVFDPTAQWTGFVEPCRDENLLKHYGRFGMDPREAKPYKGMIFEVTDTNISIDFRKYMNLGEITVFTLNKLGPGEYDIAVQNIIDSIFRVGWEESTELRMLIVFDEVHRLLEKYGGKGGYVALEKAAREFRKWGIGMIMCSQVLADFKEAIAGNVLTDVQLNTKSITDIDKVKEKYGEEYAKRISRQAVGVGMLQNPKYNDGKPYFVNFRPTWHNPHKITNEEMEEYKEFARDIEEIEKKIESIKKSGYDTTDTELELKLAKDKLKLGRFRLAKIYITSLQEHLNIKKKQKG